MYILQKLLQYIRKREHGTILVEASIALGVIIPLMLVCVDLARIGYIKLVLRSTLTEALKSAQSDPALQYDMWNKDKSDSGYQMFRASRQRIADRATLWRNKFLFRGVLVNEVQHYDLSLGTEEVAAALPIAYLPPGYSARVDYWSTNIHHPTICTPNTTHHASGKKDIPNAFYTDCNSSNSVNTSDSSATLTNLSKIYPTVLSSFVEVKTMFFGRLKMNVQVSGYPRFPLPFSDPLVVTTPTPAPCIGPVESGHNTLCADYTKAGFGGVMKSYLCNTGYCSFRGTLNNPAVMTDIRNQAVHWFGAGTALFRNHGDMLYIDDNNNICYTTTSPTYDDATSMACVPLCGQTQYCTRTNVTGCFVPGTKIQLYNGEEKSIENIVYTDVLKNPLNGEAVTIKRLIKGAEKENIYTFHVGGKKISVTKTHPMFTDHGLKKAMEVSMDDKILIQDKTYLFPDEIKIEAPSSNLQVYNIELDLESRDAYERAIIANGIATGDYLLQQEIS
jgi:hypothetical protein